MIVCPRQIGPTKKKISTNIKYESRLKQREDKMDTERKKHGLLI